MSAVSPSGNNRIPLSIEHSNLPSKTSDKIAVSKQASFEASIGQLTQFLTTKKIALKGEHKDVHQAEVIILHPEEYGAKEVKGALTLIVKPGPGRSDSGILAREVLSCVGLEETVPRAAAVIASELDPTDKKTYKIFTNPEGKLYAVSKDDICFSYTLKGGQEIVSVGEDECPYIVDGMQAKALTFSVVTDKYDREFVVASELVTLHDSRPTKRDGYVCVELKEGWYEVPQELLLPVTEDEISFILNGIKYTLVQDSASDIWSLTIDGGELTSLLSSDAKFWSVDHEDKGYVVPLACDEVVGNDNELYIQRGGIFFPIDDKGSLLNATQVCCLVQECVMEEPDVAVMASDEAFQKGANWEGFIDSVLSMVLICPQDSKVTEGDTNFLVTTHPQGGYAAVFIDTDEAFPTNNSYSEMLSEHVGKGIAVLRPGLLAFDKAGETLDGVHLAHARMRMHMIVEKKTSMLKVLENKLTTEQIAAQSERIDRIGTFLEEHRTSSFSLQKLVFFVFPQVKTDWKAFKKNGIEKRDQLAELVGFTTVELQAQERTKARPD